MTGVRNGAIRPSAAALVWRRYPGFGVLAVCAALALMLPSALMLPHTGPATLAEYAPVPGDPDGRDAPLAELSLSSSTGVGAGGGGGAGPGVASADPSDALPTGKGRRRAGTKRCVGSPPRQTEDPMSPQCHAFFDGDNGGSTGRGVTGDEIRVVFVVACGVGPDGLVDLDDTSDPAHRPGYAALLRYFNNRYQTYNRRVHGWLVNQCSRGDPSVTANRILAELRERVDPFAVVLLDQPKEWAREAARRGILALVEGPLRHITLESAPYIISYGPDIEDHATHVVRFVCTQLAGRPARLSGIPADRQRTRRFALIYIRMEDGANVGRQLITDGLARECGHIAGTVSQTSSSYSLDITRWRTEGVTTVIDVGIAADWTRTAETQGWHPEWVSVPDVTKNGPPRNYPAVMANAFGFWFERRRAEALEEQDWYRAFREGCPDCPHENVASVYDEMLLLFTGIQAAGPNLSAHTVDDGLHALPPRPSPNPWTPAAYFAPGNYSFIKDAAVIRWDNTGIPTNATRPGCWRLVEHGKRYRNQDWYTHPGDTIFDPPGQWPCMGE